MMFDMDKDLAVAGKANMKVKAKVSYRRAEGKSEQARFEQGQVVQWRKQI